MANHLLVSYEAFINAPLRHLRQIWRFLGVDAVDVDLHEGGKGVSHLVEGFEQWKLDATGPIDKGRPRRAEAHFSDEVLTSVKRNLLFGGQVPPRYFDSPAADMAGA